MKALIVKKKIDFNLRDLSKIEGLLSRIYSRSKMIPNANFKGSKKSVLHCHDETFLLIDHLTGYFSNRINYIASEPPQLKD